MVWRFRFLMGAALLTPGCDERPSDQAESVSSRPDAPDSTNADGSTGPAPLPCPSDMKHVAGSYCPDVQHDCARWMETKGRYAKFRCAIYTGARCLSESRVEMSFCIDRTEYASVGEELPRVHTTWKRAAELCMKRGKRLCGEAEWQFACEGEEMLPYPYGWERDASACNIDRKIVMTGRAFFDLRAAVGSHARCESPFGVLDMSGNVEEWVANDRKDQRFPSILKGAWWQPGQNHCRAAMLDHGPLYAGLQVGFRCCTDARWPTRLRTVRPRQSAPARSVPPPDR